MNRRNATLVLGALALGALGKTSRARASASDPGPLFRLFAKSSGFSADFVEEKRIKLLKAPIVNRGRLYFSRPHQFARHVDAPFRAAMFLKDRELVLWDESGTHQIDLSKSPAVAALATSFLALLQGHHEPLAANYGIVFSGSAAGEWNLVLEPKPQALKRMVRQLAFRHTRQPRQHERRGSQRRQLSLALHQRPGEPRLQRTRTNAVLHSPKTVRVR